VRKIQYHAFSIPHCTSVFSPNCCSDQQHSSASGGGDRESTRSLFLTAPQSPLSLSLSKLQQQHLAAAAATATGDGGRHLRKTGRHAFFSSSQQIY